MNSGLTKLCITIFLTIIMVMPIVPLNNYPAGAADAVVTGEYNPEAARLVVETVKGANLDILAEESGGELVRTGPLNYCTLQFQAKEDTQNKVLQLPGVLSAEWSEKYTLDGAAESVGNLVAINDPEYSLQWSLKKVRADQVWEEGATGEGVIVAVVDTGVDLDHPDLVDDAQSKNNLVQGYNAFTQSSLPGADQDDNGHGTSVAGVIAALNNNLGIVGLAYNAKIMPIKAMDKEGAGEDDIIADGIVWAVNHGAKIINMSIGSETQTKVLDDALQYAADRGCLLVAASGNIEGYINLQNKKSTRRTAGVSVAYPGANPNVIAVSAVDMNDEIADFSLTGPEVLLSAPGYKVLTNYWSETRQGCAYSTGTSIAAPFVSAAGALLWSKYPEITAEEIRRALIKSAYDLGEKGVDDDYGYGRLDMLRAIKTFQEPASVTSPAGIGWEGAKIYSHGSSEEPQAALSIPAGSFSHQIDNKGIERKILVLLNESEASPEFPAGIEPAGLSFEINWGEAISQKALSLELRLSEEVQPGLPDQSTSSRQAKIAYLYKWNNSRWIRVGGGVSSADSKMQVTVYEPGIYRAGWSLEPDYDRISGQDRIGTAIKIAKQAFPTGADNVIIARADSFPDALAGAPLAYKLHAPILLTNTEMLPGEVYQAIEDFSPRNIFILGGSGAVSDRIAEELFTITNVRRIAGENRYATAAAVADMLGTTGKAVVVNSANFPDAIAAASHASFQGIPILLTPSDNLVSETQNSLKKNAVTDVQVIGGTGVIAETVFAELTNATRISGRDRFETSAHVLQANQPLGRIVFLATGLNFPDALTGGILAALNSSNIILIPQDGPTPEQIPILESLAGRKAVAFGGNQALTSDALKEVSLLLE